MSLRVKDMLARAGAYEALKTFLRSGTTEFHTFVRRLSELDQKAFDDLCGAMKKELGAEVTRNCTICCTPIVNTVAFFIDNERRCDKCKSYVAYLDRFSKEERRRILMNRNCHACKVNKVGSDRITSRYCPDCRELRAQAKSGVGKESRSFFQAMAMAAAIAGPEEEEQP